MKTIEEIRQAFDRVHQVATGKSDRAYMSIPAEPKRDADLIVSAAIDELEQLRKVRPGIVTALERLRSEIDAALEGLTQPEGTCEVWSAGGKAHYVGDDCPGGHREGGS